MSGKTDIDLADHAKVRSSAGSKGYRSTRPAPALEVVRDDPDYTAVHRAA